MIIILNVNLNILEIYFNFDFIKVKDQILKYQHPITGLFPIDPNDINCVISHVRDSVYCATAIWALHKCYK